MKETHGGGRDLAHLVAFQTDRQTDRLLNSQTLQISQTSEIFQSAHLN